ncbi:MAG: hypothetical protein V2I97_17930 [Desulfococcaceae bacterium]|jgi:hypothetical protein|nr:hypothetical protein [Desulfococcaceae bacterium]
MKAAQKDRILRNLGERVHLLYQDMDRHRNALSFLLEGQPPDSGNAACSRELKLKAAIRDAIGVLDQSRKAFKSKQLETLRIELTQVLAEAE